MSKSLRELLENVSPAEVNRLTTAHLNGKFVESLGLLGYLRNYIRAEGVHLWDSQGRRYVDFLAGYGSIPLGHNPPVVEEALRDVLERRLPHFVLMAPEVLPAKLGECLARLAPGDLSMAFFASSGSEAIDGALKLARAATGRQRFIAAEGAYHGSTFGAMSITDDVRTRRFEPLDDCVRVPWGDSNAIESELRGRHVAAVVLEPIQAEGGIRLPPQGYLRQVAAACQRTGTLLIVDEIQTGFGRTGQMFACTDEGVVPDVLVLAKALSGGMVPASCYLTRPDVWRLAYGTLRDCELHCTTFRGGPLACAAALATIEAIVEDDLCGRARDLGDFVGESLKHACAGRSNVAVRGRGLLWGVELTGLGQGVAAALAAQWVVVRLLEKGYVTQVATLAPNVIRVEPPLTIQRADIEGFAQALNEILKEEAPDRWGLAKGVTSRLVSKQVERLTGKVQGSR